MQIQNRVLPADLWKWNRFRMEEIFIICFSKEEYISHFCEMILFAIIALIIIVMQGEI